MASVGWHHIINFDWYDIVYLYGGYILSSKFDFLFLSIVEPKPKPIRGKLSSPHAKYQNADRLLIFTEILLVDRFLIFILIYF